MHPGKRPKLLISYAMMKQEADKQYDVEALIDGEEKTVLRVSNLMALNPVANCTSDVEIRTVDGYSLCTNSYLIAGISARLRKHIVANPRCSFTFKIRFPERVLQPILNFAVTGEITIPPDDCQEILQCAKYLDIEVINVAMGQILAELQKAQRAHLVEDQKPADDHAPVDGNPAEESRGVPIDTGFKAHDTVEALNGISHEAEKVAIVNNKKRGHSPNYKKRIPLDGPDCHRKDAAVLAENNIEKTSQPGTKRSFLTLSEKEVQVGPPSKRSGGWSKDPGDPPAPRVW